MGGVDVTCTTLYTARVTLNTHATYTFVCDIDFLARFEVVEFARACNSDALVHPVALQETLRDLPLHIVTNAGAALLRTRQTNNRNNSPPQLTTLTFVTLLLPFSPSAIPRNPTEDTSLL